MRWLIVILGSLKFSKVLLSGGTMLLSIFTYAWIFGWWYAVGFVLLIFVHEMGHFLAARQRGLDVGLPTFIPFVGAWIQLKELPHDAETEAYIALAGPVLGTAGALVCYFASFYYSSDLLLALSYAGFFINLFNLIPLSPLDGGRITAIVSPKMWLLGVPILAGLFVVNPSPFLLIVALLALPHLFSLWNSRHNPDQPYYAATVKDRVVYSVWYLGLVIFLASMSYQVHSVLSLPQ